MKYITLILSATFCMNLEAAAPAWFTAMKDNSWTTVASGVGQKLTDVKPNPLPGGNTGQGAITGAWSGACVDQTRGELILAANGGHNDYYGNEVYACAIRNDTPKWIRLTDPTPANMLGSGYGAANLDGLPRSMHTYNGATFANGKIWYASTSDASPLAASSDQMWTFDRNAAGSGPFPIAYADVVSRGLWQNKGKAGTTGGLIEGNGGLWDRVNNMIWCFGASEPPLYSVNPATTQVTKYTRSESAPWGGTCGGVAYGLGNPTSAILAVFNHDYSGSSPYVWIKDLGNPSSALIKKTLSTTSKTGSGCVYHQVSRSFYLYERNGAAISQVKIPANPLTDSWAAAWTTLNPASSNMVIPPHFNTVGTYSRFNIIEDMGNGQSALVVLGDITMPVYVYKLPGGVTGAERRVSPEANIALSITPNPVRVSGIIRITGVSGLRGRLASLYDLRGRKSAVLSFDKGGKAKLKAAGLSSGVYILKAEIGHREISRQILVQK